jgi:acetyl-CoA acetyltransferase
VTINRFCESSLSAAVNISHAIKAGDLGIGIACGVESMSRSGWALIKGDARFPRGARCSCSTPCGLAPVVHPTQRSWPAMIETAQNVADRYALSREEIDAFALRSQRRAVAARDSGRLAEEIMPVSIPATKTTSAGSSSTMNSSGTTLPPHDWPPCRFNQAQRR